MVNLKDSSGRSLYFSNRKEYYRRKRISEGVKRFYSQHREKQEVPTTSQRFPRAVLAYYSLGSDGKGNTLNERFEVRAYIIGSDAEDSNIFKRLRLALDKKMEELKRNHIIEPNYWIPFEAEGKDEIDSEEKGDDELNEILFEVID